MGNSKITTEQNVPVECFTSSNFFYNSPHTSNNYVVPRNYNVNNTMRHADRYSRNGSSRCNGIRSS